MSMSKLSLLIAASLVPVFASACKGRSSSSDEKGLAVTTEVGGNEVNYVISMDRLPNLDTVARTDSAIYKNAEGVPIKIYDIQRGSRLGLYRCPTDRSAMDCQQARKTELDLQFLALREEGRPYDALPDAVLGGVVLPVEVVVSRICGLAKTSDLTVAHLADVRKAKFDRHTMLSKQGMKPEAIAKDGEMIQLSGVVTRLEACFVWAARLTSWGSTLNNMSQAESKAGTDSVLRAFGIEPGSNDHVHGTAADSQTTP